MPLIISMEELLKVDLPYSYEHFEAEPVFLTDLLNGPYRSDKLYDLSHLVNHYSIPVLYFALIIRTFPNLDSFCKDLSYYILSDALWKTGFMNFAGLLETYDEDDLNSRIASRGVSVSANSLTACRRAITTYHRTTIGGTFNLYDCVSSALELYVEDGVSKGEFSRFHPALSGMNSISRIGEESIKRAIWIKLMNAFK